jgi:copper chaperone CopZ
MLTASLRQLGMTKTHRNDFTVATTSLAVGGMTCGTCERLVRRTLEGLTGVIHATVNLRNAEAIVEHLRTLVDAESLATAVRDVGYEAGLIEAVADTHSVAPLQASGAACSCGCCGPSK